ncbi:endospore germination permease [Paenibacillus sp.]|uniref:GerAB/ArcD/ProY family transporter n=1 Tax=Paenibacillus sp. TaxID=58172 RepID=UPI002811F3CF|nr:endospore germination permease [Paenibacillus sp.]
MNKKEGEHPETVISARQSSSIIASAIIGVGVLTLPRGAAEYARQSAWFSVILGALVAMLAVAVITLLSRRFPHQGIVAYGAEILGLGKGKAFGRLFTVPLLLLYIGSWGFSTVIVARMFGEVVITTVLTQTPLEVIISTMLLTAYILTLYGIEVMARVNEMLLPIIVVPVLLIAISSFQSARLYHLFPLQEGVDLTAFLRGIIVSSFAFLGFEVMTVFSEYVQQSDKLLRANLAGIAIPGGIYALIVFSGVAVFGVDELQLLAWPTLELVKVTEVPGLILERMESAFLGVWVAAVFTTTGTMYCATTLLIHRILGFKGKKPYRIIATILLPVFYWLSLLPQNIHALFQYQRYSGMLGGVAALLIPALLLGIAIVRGKGVKGGGAT